jgi:hypothetical protein
MLTMIDRAGLDSRCPMACQSAYGQELFDARKLKVPMDGSGE